MLNRRSKNPVTPPQRGMFTVDTRSLGRQPGATREEARTVPAPDSLHAGLSGIPAGAGVEVAVRLEAVTEGVLATGTVAAPVTGECARCLDPLASSVEASFQELYRYAARPAEDDEDSPVLDGSLLDLEQVVRDALVLALPLSPLCSDDCPGLCAQCGVRLAEAGPGHRHDDGVRPGWEALRHYGGFDRQDDQTGRRASAGDRQEG
ncbi:MAG TPA: DUF177 domain-containing protein [Streptosporangiaceae bacterium]|nr:DUF177 domain-containing protein [Streptosporangiaceae bacterium]